METPIIRYNLNDRGRQHTGQPRRFNIKAICDAINGPACQETVATRGMIGYYGHMPRIRYGMNPVEGVLDNGKYVPIEPAFITTHLKADYDGNVEHRAEFLDTASGRLAAKLWESKMGGFSSAIDTNKPTFYGLDFVLQPNFVSNSFRGVALDDAVGGNTGDLTYDDVYEAEQDEIKQDMIFLLDSATKERTLANATIKRLSEENEDLLSRLAAKGKDNKDTGTTLDSVPAPLVVSRNPLAQMQRETDEFNNALLPAFVEPRGDVSNADPAMRVPLYGRLLNQASR